MKISGFVQTVILMLLLASAASCEVSKTYFQKTFQTSHRSKSDSSAIKFMQPDTLDEFTLADKNTVILKTEKTIMDNETQVIEKETTPVIKSSNSIRTKRKRSGS